MKTNGKTKQKGAHPNAKYKDSLFRRIFGGKDKRSAEWRLQLYNALSGKNHTNPDDLRITTLENVIYIHMKNDISFLVDSQMSLYEHQSTWNLNMPLRGLFYFAKLYQKYLADIKEDIHDTKLVFIPSPKYIVFYNGNKKTELVSKLRLSDAFTDFKEKGDFEWTATMMNINKDANLPLQNNCKPLYDYICFVDRVKNNLKKGLSKDRALEEAVEWGIKCNLLDGFLREQRAEVLGMDVLTEFDEEAYDNRRRKEGYDEGIIAGAQQKAIEDAISFYKNGASIDLIAKSLNMTLEQVKEIVKETVTV